MIRGDIYFADLYEAGIHPIVIVSRNELNRGINLVVVPITSAHFDRRRNLPNCVTFRAGEFGLSKDCVAQCEAILTVTVDQLHPDPIGHLDDSAMRDVVRGVGIVIAADCEPE